MIKYREARWDDLEQILDLIAKGFSVQFNSQVNKMEGEEHRILFTYLYSRKEWSPGNLFLAENNGTIVAAVGFFPQILSFEGIKIPIWAISPVVTHPEYRGRGIAGDCLLLTLEAIKNKGIPAVFLWGLPKYYPKFGFVPVLPRYKTRINPDRIMNNNFNYVGEFHELNKDELNIISDLYNGLNSKEYWLNPDRALTWWQNRFEEMNIELANLKEVPFPKKDNFIVWENYLGKISGYLYFKEDFERKRIIIEEANAVDIETAMAMLTAFINQFVKFPAVLEIRGTPDHFLNMAAYRMGGINLLPAPLAGMIKVIDWPGFWRQLLPLFNRRLDSCIHINDLSRTGFCWRFDLGQTSLKLTWSSSKGFEPEFTNFQTSGSADLNVELTKLVIGLYDHLDISNAFAHIVNDNSRTSTLELLHACFPFKYPFIWDANYLY